MQLRYIPVWLRHSPAPSVEGFAVLAGLEAAARGVLLSVFPLVMYRALGEAAVVSRVYFWIGLASLAIGLMVPWATRYLPRRWMYTTGALMHLTGSLLVIFGGIGMAPVTLFLTAAGIVTIFVCFNAYVLDYIARTELGRSETLRMFYSALSWAVGPALGVWLMKFWEPLPFVVSAVFVIILIATFWVMRLGNGKLITRARAPAPNPVAYLNRFFAQPRLVAGWMFAVLRSTGWWVYIVYLPIYCVENGLGDQLAGLALSATNAILFASPLMLRWVVRRSVRAAVRMGFAVSAFFFAAATLMAMVLPLGTVLALFIGAGFLILLDICGGLPFLMAVKPSERTEMSAVYSSFRDVSGIVTPAMAWAVLQMAPVEWVFAACGTGLFLAFIIAGRLHPRLGASRARLAVEAAE
jgi:ACDE family multidrug resistance protein